MNDIILKINPFKEEDGNIHNWENFLKSLSSLGKKEISFLFKGNKENIKIYVKLLKQDYPFFKNIFYSNFPNVYLEKIKDKKIKNNWGNNGNIKSIIYKDEEDIKTIEDFSKGGQYMDPFKGVISIFYDIDKNENLNIYFNIQFKQNKGILYYFNKGLNLLGGKSLENLKEENKEMEKKIFLLISYNYETKIKEKKKSLKNHFISVFENYGGKFSLKLKNKKTPLLSNQISNFFHIPLNGDIFKGIKYINYKKLPYPTNIPRSNIEQKKELTTLGKVHYREEENITFGIKKEDKFRHMYIIGKTGTGKSTFISNMVKSDIEKGNGLCLLDPHGDLIDIVLEHIPQNRINDVILFDVSDTDFPIGFNLLQANTEEEKGRITSGIVGTFYKLFEHSWGPRLEYILRNVVLSVIDYPNATLMHILRVLIDKNFREEVIKNITDEVVKKFWLNEFNKWNDKQREEAIGPITNKIGQFLSSKVVRNIFGQPKTKLNIRKIMDEGKILLVNLSKGKIGEDNSTMIGSLLTTKIQIDAMSRADIPINQRKDFYLYIDEFQNFATKSFTTILSEARKYRLSLIIANQFISQLDEDIRNAIFGNVGTIMSFTLGKDDADIISGQFKNIINTNDLLSLPMFTGYIKLMIDGLNSEPFSFKTIPLISPQKSHILINKIKKQSRTKYAIKKEELESLMTAWNNKNFTIQEKIMEKSKMEGVGIKNKKNENNYSKKNLNKKDTNKIENEKNINNFSINDIQLGKEYFGYIKLKYNFGLFIVVNGIEGLLHKSEIKIENGVNWKKFYNIGDKIQIKAREITEIKGGEKRIIWTQNY